MSMLFACFVLAMIFGPLSLIAWVIRRAARKARERRERQARIDEMVRKLSHRYAWRSPVPLRTPETPSELRYQKQEEPTFVLAPFALPVMDLDTRSLPEEEPFKGKGGQSGGAGASGEWAPTAEVIEDRATEVDTTTTDSTPDVSVDVS